MKKLFTMFLLISVLFIFSCQNVDTSESNNSDKIEAESDNSNDNEKEYNNSNKDENKSNTSPGNSGGAYSDKAGFSLSTYEEYLEYIENNELPDGFVYYEDIKQYGEFDGLAAPTGISSEVGAIVGYGYSISDEKGYEHFLTVENNKGTKFTEQINDEDIQVDLSDMRYTVSGEWGVYYYNNIRYTYTVGQLLSIQWYEYGWLYTISDFSDGYPDNDGSALAKLIYLE